MNIYLCEVKGGMEGDRWAVVAKNPEEASRKFQNYLVDHHYINQEITKITLLRCFGVIE